ncbi:MAG TPA: biotin transporter BioY [Jiangellaceae bacterium]
MPRITATRLTVVDLARIAVFAALIAALAQASVHLFGNAVPITGQTLGIMLAGLILGAVRGGLAALVYVALGAVGLPVFANATGGFGVISGPTGGFILAFPVAAFVIGLLARRQLTGSTAFTACVVGGIGLVYLVGVPWLAWRLGLGAEQALLTGAVAFLPGDLLKAGLATYIALGVHRAYPALRVQRPQRATEPEPASSSV